MRKARKRQPDASGIVRFLKRFETPEDLEQECYRRGVKGVRDDEFQCVVARLIEDEFPAVGRVEVWPGYGGYAAHGRLIALDTALELPDAARTFAMEFDHGTYRELEESRDE